LGLDIGQCHIFRNAGGRVTSDAIRSFSMTQKLMGTREIYVMHHSYVCPPTENEICELVLSSNRPFLCASA
jgi:hypothetical protein